MRDFIAFCTLMACLVVLGASIIALIKPLPKFRLGTRKRALGGLGVAFGLLILTAVVIPEPNGKAKPATAPLAITPKPSASASSAAAAPAVPQTTVEQDAVLTFVRNIVIQSDACRGDVGETQRGFDKLAEGGTRPIDVYEAAKRGFKNCTGTSKEFRGPDALELVPSRHLATAKDAIQACDRSVRKRTRALQIAQEVLNGDDSLEQASNYNDLKREAHVEDIRCRSALIRLAAAEGIPDSLTDFLTISYIPS